MKSKSLVIVELHTNTIYVSETAYRDIRKPKRTEAIILFRHYKKMYPTATVEYLSDEEYYNRFHELEMIHINSFLARNVISDNNPERTFIHYERIA